MRKTLLLLLALLPALAASQGLTTNAPGVSSGKVLASFPFATAGCFASGAGGVSITRATNATYVDGDGAVQTCAAGEFRVAPDGLLVEPARTNYALASDGMSSSTSAVSPWALSNATVATVAGAPIGTWAEVTSTTSAGVMYSGTNPAAAAALVASVWMAKASGTGAAGVYFYSTGVVTVTACTCLRSDGGTCAANITDSNRRCLASVSDLGTTPIRLSAIATLSGTVTSDSAIGVAPGALGTSTGTTRFAAADLQVGTYPTSHITTTSTAVARNADQISATVPAVPANHAIRVDAVAYADQTTSTGTRVWSLGTSGANTASLDIKSIYTVTDAASGVKAHTTTAVPSYASHTLTTLNKGGTLSLNLPGSTAGAGTGLLATPPTTLYFGSASGTSLHLGGTIKGLKIYKATKIGDAK